MNRILRPILGAIGSVLLLLLAISALYPELTAQVLAHAAPSLTPFANWFAAHVMGTGADGVAMAIGAVAIPLNDMRQKVGELTTAQRSILDKAKTEKRELSAEENAEYERMDAEALDLLEKIGAAEASEKRENNLASREAHLSARQNAPVRPDIALRAGAPNRTEALRQLEEIRDFLPPDMQRRIDALSAKEYRSSFRKKLVFGSAGLTPDEKRALSVGNAAAGGNTVPLEEFRPQIIKSVDNAAVIRTIANVLPPVTQAQSLGAPTMSADVADADWTSEVGTGSEDSTLAFGKRELHPYPLAKRIKVSDKLLRASPIGMSNFVLDRLGYKQGIAQSTAFNTGDGANKPLGLYTVSGDGSGITTSREVEIGNGSGAVDGDKVITARYTLRQGYVGPNTRWHMHRLWFAKIRKLKATTGDYLWQPGLSRGDPVGMILLDIPVVLDEYAPSVTTHGAGVYGGILGDFSFYWIVDALDIVIRRLEELYAETNEVGFISRSECDGMPVLEDAFVRMLAAT